ncbi:hypothetical protein Ancab_029566 [Ancistrocladus abbreviatus]
MWVEASAVTAPLPSEVPKERVARQSANYHPSIWGERFITYTYDDKVIHAWHEEAEVLKEKVRKMFTDVDFAEKLNLIDSVQRLGVAYNFEGEIKGALEQNFSAYLDHFYHDDDLHRVSLLFRLLRQHGYHMKSSVRAYFEESKWLDKGYMPTMEEYMKAISVICRVMDDMVSHKFEQEREHVPTAVECNMKQYGVSEEQACHEFNKQVEDAWKDTNQACLKPTATSSSVLTRMVNLARVIDLLYKEQDCYTHSTKLKDFVTSLFLDSIEI